MPLDLSAWELSRMLIALLIGIVLVAIPAALLLVRARRRESRLRRQVARLTTSQALLSGPNRSGSPRRNDESVGDIPAQTGPGPEDHGAVPADRTTPADAGVEAEPAGSASTEQAPVAVPAAMVADVPVTAGPVGNGATGNGATGNGATGNGATAGAPAAGPAAGGPPPHVRPGHAPQVPSNPPSQTPSSPPSQANPNPPSQAPPDPPTQPERVTGASRQPGGSAPEGTSPGSSPERGTPNSGDHSWNPSMFATEESAERFRRDYAGPMDEHRKRLAELRSQLSDISIDQGTNSTHNG